VYRDRLSHEDLEDCLGQAALELVARARARADGRQGERHIANALEQKFVSRIIDRQRALGRRPFTITTDANESEGMAGGDESPSFQIVAPNGEPSQRASTRDELERLREVAAELTDDQRLVLACQVSLGMDSAEFCERFGWSPEKFRKVAQRARTRLRTLLTEYELGDRCRRLEGDVLAYAAHAASMARSSSEPGLAFHPSCWPGHPGSPWTKWSGSWAPVACADHGMPRVLRGREAAVDLIRRQVCGDLVHVAVRPAEMLPRAPVRHDAKLAEELDAECPRKLRRAASMSSTRNPATTGLDSKRHRPSATARAEELQLRALSHGGFDGLLRVLPDHAHAEHFDSERPHARELGGADADPPDALHLHLSTLRPPRRARRQLLFNRWIARAVGCPERTARRSVASRCGSSAGRRRYAGGPAPALLIGA
jgi:RNA polymerase sigma factor (sigma-70 family)